MIVLLGSGLSREVERWQKFTPRWCGRSDSNIGRQFDVSLGTIAYLDAGSGSLIASAIVAGLAGVAVVFKVGFRRLGLLFSPRRRRAAREAALAGTRDSVDND